MQAVSSTITHTTASHKPDIRHDWTLTEAIRLFEMPFMDLIFTAQSLHRCYFNPNEIQLSTLLNIKTGGCAEDCKYCPQSAAYDTGQPAGKLMELSEVITAAQTAKAAGATRFCMGAAWREPKQRDMEKVIPMIQAVKAMGMETCVTLGMLTPEQSSALKNAGLDYYNHNLDTSEEFYSEIITTRSYNNRLDTLENVRNAGIKVCCGGIMGMGEGVDDRAALLVTLANLPDHPESVPINMLVKVPGTPLAENGHSIDEIDFIRTIAAARIMMPASMVRLSAGRNEMSEATQVLCFLAGANSIFYGEKLLTTTNPAANEDMELFKKLGISAL